MQDWPIKTRFVYTQILAAQKLDARLAFAEQRTPNIVIESSTRR